MPEKHPNTHRWGGPGASHEDASKPMPDQSQPRPDEAVGSRPNVSQASDDGGEQDEKHSRVDGERDAQPEVGAEGESFAQDATGLEILVNTDDNVEGRQSLLDHVAERIGSSLRRFGPRLTRVEVHLSDLNAGKSGPADKRCSIEARPKGLAPFATTDEAGTLDAAVSGAAAKMVRLLESEFGRRGDKGARESIRGRF